MKPIGIAKDISLVEYRKWKKCQVILQRQQMLDRIEKFNKEIGKFKDFKQEIDEKREIAYFGYHKSQPSQSPTRIVMRGDGERSKFLKVNQSVERKVRNLLQGTELVEIAKTARIVIEIVKDDSDKLPPLLVSKKIEPSLRAV